MALRGQELPTDELVEFNYRRLFGMTQEELENEPLDIFNLNLAIMGKLEEIGKEEEEHRKASEDRINR